MSSSNITLEIRTKKICMTITMIMMTKKIPLRCKGCYDNADNVNSSAMCIYQPIWTCPCASPFEEKESADVGGFYEIKRLLNFR